jgi:hypothetical protein
MPLRKEVSVFGLYFALTNFMERCLWETGSSSASQNCHLKTGFVTFFLVAHHWHWSWALPIKFTFSHTLAFRSILILYAHLRLGLLGYLLPSGAPTKFFYACVLRTSSFISLYFIVPIIVKSKVLELVITQFSPASCHVNILWSGQSPQRSLPNAFSVHVIHLMWAVKFHIHTHIHKTNI